MRRIVHERIIERTIIEEDAPQKWVWLNTWGIIFGIIASFVTVLAFLVR